tara:strand:+ start:866 stop:4054 length:3189 start_codon:yes stop_codon:yes gene_type:complete
MQEDREILIDQTQKEDERSDLKQHADKMLRDFEKFNSNSSNRAIWELVQNACDLTTECKIEIDYRNDKFSFSHNGKPFVSKSLISLIKQVSGKYGEEEIEEVGKYGTGFLTTHTFGRKFTINSVLKAGELHLPIVDFLIDRSPKEWQLLSDKISDQKKKVYKILEEEQPISVTEYKTTFTFLPESDKEFEYIEKSKIGLDKFIPLVFTINDRLKEVKIINKDGAITRYKFLDRIKFENGERINLYQTIVIKNNDEQHIYSIVDEETDIEVILPINKDKEVFEFDVTISRLFFYYPLIGSQDFGINFVINCKHFLPTEPRDGIHLKSDKDQVQDQEAKNREVIDKSSELIFEFLRSNVIEVKNPLLYTNVNFKKDSDDKYLNEYFENLQNKWNDNLKSLPIVNTNNGYKTIEEATYLSDDFLNVEEATFDCFYELLAKFYGYIPIKAEVLTWSRNAINWKNESTKLLTHEDLVSKIEECKLEDFNKDTLNTYYSYLINHDLTKFFNDYSLVPNINGDFNKVGFLLKAKHLNHKLIELGKELIPCTIAKLIHPEFVFNFGLSTFHRRDFSDDVYSELSKKELSDSIFFSENLKEEDFHMDLVTSSHKVEEDYFKSLLDFCKLVNNLESTSKPNQLLKKILRYYNCDEDLIELKDVEEDSENIEYRAIRKILVKMFCNLIALHNNDWVEKNIEFLYELCSLKDDSYKEVYKESKIYPNQIFELRLSESLKRDVDVIEEIKEYFLKVNKEDINEILCVKNFNEFLSDDDYITNKYLTSQIEEKIFLQNVTDLESHPNKPTILKIIPKLTEKYYQDLFPLLNEKKATIMISVVSQEDKKEDIFAIVSLEDAKLKRVGSLIKEKNFEDLLNKAEQLIQQEIHKKSDFAHKYKIGTNIERLIREKLSAELQNRVSFKNAKEIEANDIQGGQDIVITLDKNDVYFIEVKSRWDSDRSVSMSKLQLQRAAEEKERFSLCSVDITKYTGNNNKYDLSAEEILPLTKFVNDIGGNVKPLIEPNLIAEKNEDKSIHLIDYRGIIPQDIINQGENFNQFVDSLLIQINKIAYQNA